MAALQPALRKLEALLNGKLMLLKGVRSDITFLKSELEALDAFLVQMSLVDDHRMIKLQELSNSIQESIDELELRFDDERLGNFKGFTKRSMSLLPLAKIRHPDSLMILVKEVAEQHARDGIAAGISNHGNSAVDPQVCSINNDVSDLVGMDGPRDELTKWLLEEEDALGQRLKMVCIVGDRGLGKTTLAEQLRHTLREYPRCQAFVLVSRTPDMVKILRTILCQVTGQSYANTEAAGDDQQHLIDKISKFLTDKSIFNAYVFFKFSRFLEYFSTAGSNSPGISATVAVVRKEAEKHPNRITLCINDKEEIFLEKLESAQVCRDENRDAGSKGTIGIEAEEDMLFADRNNLAGNDKQKEVFHDNSYAIASCSRTGEIEEVEAQ